MSGIKVNLVTLDLKSTHSEVYFLGGILQLNHRCDVSTMFALRQVLVAEGSDLMSSVFPLA